MEKGSNNEGVAYFEALNTEYALPLTEYFLGYALFRNNENHKALTFISESLEKKSFKDRYIGDRKFAEFLTFNSNGVEGQLFQAGLNELEKYRKAKGLAENSQEILSLHAFFYLKQRNYSTAITFFRQLAETVDDNEEKVSNLFLIAYIYEEKIRDYSKADVVLEEILTISENRIAYQKKIDIYEKTTEQLLKKGDLLLKYLRNLGELNKGKEDIALSLQEFEKIFSKAEIIFVKLNRAAEGVKRTGRPIIKNKRLVFLRSQVDALRKEYVSIATKL